MNEQSVLYTVGHSNHPLEQFLGLLTAQGIELIGDVRSTPFSRFSPQFNRARLEGALARHGIGYVFLGKELGARSPDPAHYDDGKVSYRRLAASELFQQGLRHLLVEIEKRRVAIMCAERAPLDCHRTLLVGREAERAGVRIRHILPDGSVREHEDLIRELIGSLKPVSADLFSAPISPRDRAYDARGSQIAYTRKTNK